MSQPLPNQPQENPDAPPQATPPAPQQGNPAPTPPASPVPPQQGNDAPRHRRIGDDNPFAGDAVRTIQDAISALPEKIVDAVREVTPPAPVVNTPKNGDTNTGENTRSGRRSFADWWFNK